MRLLKTLLQATGLVGHFGSTRSHNRWPGQAHIRGPNAPRRPQRWLTRLFPRILQ
jgi:hypothetical protein